MNYHQTLKKIFRVQDGKKWKAKLSMIEPNILKAFERENIDQEVWEEIKQKFAIVKNKKGEDEKRFFVTKLPDFMNSYEVNWEVLPEYEKERLKRIKKLLKKIPVSFNKYYKNPHDVLTKDAFKRVQDLEGRLKDYYKVLIDSGKIEKEDANKDIISLRVVSAFFKDQCTHANQ